ncbi:MAG TPA: hypothetical protein VJN62_03015 [Gemmatimonadales bacterium]|nr:hypothetical protein [Gemmatimonadales bacterium]
MIELLTLGGIDLKEEGRDLKEALVQPKRFALLAYLAVAQPFGFHRRDRLVALFWPELDQEHARTALRKAVHGLRAVLGEDAIIGRGAEELGLNPDRWWVDVRAFDEADVAEGLRLYRGDLLDGFFISGAPEFERWLETERDRLRARAAGGPSMDDPAAQRAAIAAKRQALPGGPARQSRPRSRAALAAVIIGLAGWSFWHWGHTPALGVTTASHAAYQLFGEGLNGYQRGDFAAAESIMVRAVELDTTFALAAYYAALSAQSRFDDPVYRKYSALAIRQSGHVTERERLLIRASFAEQLGAPDALPLADSLFRRHPEEKAVHRLLGLALLDEGDFLGAIPHLELARADSAQGRSALEAMIYAFQMADSLDAAIRVARDWVRTEPGSAQAWHQLAAGYELADRAEEALVANRNAARLRTGDIEDALLPGVVAMQTGHFDEADRVFRSPPNMGPAGVNPGRWDLVISLRNQGRLREALVEAKRYRIGEDFGPAGLGGAQPEAQVRFEMGEYQPARALFDSIAGAPTTPFSPARAARNRAWYLTHAASAMAAAGDTAMLERLADSVERVGRESSYGRDHLLHYHIRGLLAAARGRTPDAAALFARASYSLTGGFSRNNLEWGRALITLGRAPEAIPVLRGGLNGPPDASGLYATFADLHEQLGYAFEASGNADSAAVHYRWVEKAWRNADPGFQVRRTTVEARLRALNR